MIRCREIVFANIPIIFTNDFVGKFIYYLFIYLFIYLTLPKTFNRFTNRHLHNKHRQEWQGHPNSVNQLLWALYTKMHTIIITYTHSTWTGDY